MPRFSPRSKAAPTRSRKPPAKAARRPRDEPGQATVYVTRQVHFNSAHRLYNPAFSRRWNQRQFGLCSSPHSHGHNYVLEVTVRGRPDPDTGYVIDLGKLKAIL